MSILKGKILVTGASGSLGKQLLYELSKMDIRPIAGVRENSDTTYIDSLSLEKRVADLRFPDQVAKLVEGIDGVIHTAALVDFRQDRMTQFVGVNTMGAVELFKTAQKAGVKRFVHVSSIAAVGAILRTIKIDNKTNVAALPVLTEEAQFNLEHLRIPYIQTKHSAEVELLKLADNGSTELVIVNPAMIVAPSRTGDDRRKALKKFSSVFVPSLRVRANLVDIRDVAPAIINALERGRHKERYILAGDNILARELVLTISQELGKIPHLVRPPRSLLRFSAWMSLIICKLTGKSKISFYPDIVKMLDYDWAYSSMKARKELGYRTRSIYTTMEQLLSNKFYGTWQK